MRRFVSFAPVAFGNSKHDGHKNLASLLLTFVDSFKEKASRFFAVALSMGLLMFFLSFVYSAKAQDVPDASLSGSGVLQLPTDQPLSGSYYFDLSQYSFGSDDEMIGFLSTKSADHFIVRALPDLHKGIVMLDAEFYPSWTVADWNVYLNTATTLNPILPGAPNPSND